MQTGHSSSKKFLTCAHLKNVLTRNLACTLISDVPNLATADISENPNVCGRDDSAQGSTDVSAFFKSRKGRATTQRGAHGPQARALTAFSPSTNGLTSKLPPHGHAQRRLGQEGRRFGYASGRAGLLSSCRKHAGHRPQSNATSLERGANGYAWLERPRTAPLCPPARGRST